MEVDLRPYLRSDHPEWGRRGISAETCRYLGCGFLPHRVGAKTSSPLNSRLVFQVRGVLENGHHLEPVILSHSGRALTGQQEESDGKYWSYPFRKGLEIYNQDKLLLDVEACSQTGAFGLILVERKRVTKLFSENDLLIIDDLFLRKNMPEQAADDLLDIIMNRYSSRKSTMITSNRPLEDWGKLLRDNAASSAILDRLLHRGHLLKFEGKSYRLKEASIRLMEKQKSSG